MIPELIAAHGDIKGALYYQGGQLVALANAQIDRLHAVVQVAAEYQQRLSHGPRLHREQAEGAEYGHVLALCQLERELLARAAFGRQLQQPDLLVEGYQQGRLVDLFEAEARLVEDVVEGSSQFPDQRGKLGQQGRADERDGSGHAYTCTPLVLLEFGLSGTRGRCCKESASNAVQVASGRTVSRIECRPCLVRPV